MEDAGDNSGPAWSTFSRYLRASSRILCVVGAGLSAPSGLSTWRGTDGLWNNNNLKDLASPERFQEDPITVWKFYGERLLASLAAEPNAAHHALAALAQRYEGWLTVNQNVDGLLELTEYPPSQLLSIHGSLRTVRCTMCDYHINVEKPGDLPFLLLLNSTSDQPHTPILSDLPHCPRCRNMLRPAVVWFGETLAADAPDSVDRWISEESVDMVIAAGTSLQVFPAAEWVATVHECGAALAIIDTIRDDDMASECDWFIQGDVQIILPSILDTLDIDGSRGAGE
ncbi:DHS-like NAD/FAD-binding domain-containing protein [Aaosphaeria arxii CBS 175.79]|uniref:DHS-like NAD/FAD-binding domain-containing protein n=1 Tax=Aaosphaeria arxii CBS 175.79 TaxID=1450172 RepID=A0A6A5XB83_9PLEO|nr:DHS-like NAD/FAD-binding domain-containing protein [Aaosphaeria arxii CBS 175.79]KAF2010201.1 DHS-like NAD/FAD-binding domain-containing protein [Aaosphaeria arxii CBS 175.79]